MKDSSQWTPGEMLQRVECTTEISRMIAVWMWHHLFEESTHDFTCPTPPSERDPGSTIIGKGPEKMSHVFSLEPFGGKI